MQVWLTMFWLLQESLQCIYDFDVLPLNELFSDVHCPLHIIVKTNKDRSFNHAPVSPINDNLRRPKWKDEFKSAFTENIDANIIEMIHLHVKKLLQETDVNQYDINEAYKMIKDVFNDCALKCGSLKAWWNENQTYGISLLVLSSSTLM